MSLVHPTTDGHTISPPALAGRMAFAPLALSLVFAAAGLLFFARLDAPLLEPEEALYAEVPREMAVVDSWLVPVRHGQPYYEKPPLLYWLIMLSYQAFGVHDWAARLIVCAAGLATAAVTFWWGKRMFGVRAGLAGAMILCLSPRFVHQARMVTMDGLLCFFVAAALGLGQQGMRSGRLRWRVWLLSAAACGLGVLTKGPVAAILTLLPLFAYRFLDQSAARPGARGWLAYLGTMTAVALPWFALMAWHEPDFVREYFVNHHVIMRFLQPLHEEPAWFYLPVLLLGMLPWTLLLPKLVWTRGFPKPPEVRFLVVCSLWCLLFFSAADCKRMGYILPAMPSLALALGFMLDRELERRSTLLPSLATQGVFAVGAAGAVLAAHIDLLAPVTCAILVALAAAGSVWCLSRIRRDTPAAAWTTCALSTLALLFLALQFLLPSYYRRFSMRDQLHSLTTGSCPAQLPIACYPHHWDSIPFYLQRQDVHSYGRDRRTRLLADLERRPATLVFVKTGKALQELLQILPPGLEFVPHGQARTVTAGVVRWRKTYEMRSKGCNQACLGEATSRAQP